MALVLLAILLVRKSYHKSLFLVVAIGGSALVNLAFKSIFERARPELWDRAVEVTNYSFPSGHALSTSAFALTVVVLLWHTKWRTLAIIIGALYAATVGFTRLYLGVHYPTDVIGGWLLGIAWVAATVLITGIYKPRKVEKDSL